MFEKEAEEYASNTQFTEFGRFRGESCSITKQIAIQK